MRVFLQDVSRGKGTVGKLIYDDELYDNLNAVIEGIRFYGLLRFQENLYQKELEKRTREGIWER